MPSSPVIRSGYSDPRTPHGVGMAGAGRVAGTSLVLHEVGWLPHGLRWQFPQVLSPFWRLYYNRQPGWRVTHRGREWPLEPGHLLLIPDGLLFDCDGEPGVAHLWIHFNPAEALEAAPVEPVAMALDPVLEALAVRLIDRLETRAAAPVLAHAASALLHAAFAQLEPAALATHPPKLAAILARIDREPGSEMSNAVLARRAGLSESAFIRWFHAATGVTPAAHVQRARMKAAAHALLTTPRSIDDIAASVGFKNRHHFSRVFTRHFQCGPAAYRKRQP